MGWFRSVGMKIAMALVERGRWAQVRGLAERFIEADPYDADARLLEVMALQHLGEHAKVLDAAKGAGKRLRIHGMYGIAFVAALAALVLGRDDDARYWVRISGNHAEFAEHVRAHPELSRIDPDPALQ